MKFFILFFLCLFLKSFRSLFVKAGQDEEGKQKDRVFVDMWKNEYSNMLNEKRNSQVSARITLINKDSDVDPENIVEHMHIDYFGNIFVNGHINQITVPDEHDDTQGSIYFTTSEQRKMRLFIIPPTGDLTDSDEYSYPTTSQTVKKMTYRGSREHLAIDTFCLLDKVNLFTEVSEDSGARKHLEYRAPMCELFIGGDFTLENSDGKNIHNLAHYSPSSVKWNGLDLPQHEIVYRIKTVMGLVVYFSSSDGNYGNLFSQEIERDLKYDESKSRLYYEFDYNFDTRLHLGKVTWHHLGIENTEDVISAIYSTEEYLIIIGNFNLTVPKGVGGGIEYSCCHICTFSVVAGVNQTVQEKTLFEYDVSVNDMFTGLVHYDEPIVDSIFTFTDEGHPELILLRITHVEVLTFHQVPYFHISSSAHNFTHYFGEEILPVQISQSDLNDESYMLLYQSMDGDGFCREMNFETEKISTDSPYCGESDQHIKQIFSRPAPFLYIENFPNTHEISYNELFFIRSAQRYHTMYYQICLFHQFKDDNSSLASRSNVGINRTMNYEVQTNDVVCENFGNNYDEDHPPETFDLMIYSRMNDMIFTIPLFYYGEEGETVNQIVERDVPDVLTPFGWVIGRLTAICSIVAICLWIMIICLFLLPCQSSLIVVGRDWLFQTAYYKVFPEEREKRMEADLRLREAIRDGLKRKKRRMILKELEETGENKVTLMSDEEEQLMDRLERYISEEEEKGERREEMKELALVLKAREARKGEERAFPEMDQLEKERESRNQTFFSFKKEDKSANKLDLVKNWIGIHLTVKQPKEEEEEEGETDKEEDEDELVMSNPSEVDGILDSINLELPDMTPRIKLSEPEEEQEGGDSISEITSTEAEEEGDDEEEIEQLMYDDEYKAGLEKFSEYYKPIRHEDISNEKPLTDPSYYKRTPKLLKYRVEVTDEEVMERMKELDSDETVISIVVMLFLVVFFFLAFVYSLENLWNIYGLGLMYNNAFTEPVTGDLKTLSLGIAYSPPDYEYVQLYQCSFITAAKHELHIPSDVKEFRVILPVRSNVHSGQDSLILSAEEERLNYGQKTNAIDVTLGVAMETCSILRLQFEWVKMEETKDGVYNKLLYHFQQLMPLFGSPSSQHFKYVLKFKKASVMERKLNVGPTREIYFTLSGDMYYKRYNKASYGAILLLGVSLLGSIVALRAPLVQLITKTNFMVRKKLGFESSLALVLGLTFWVLGLAQVILAWTGLWMFESDWVLNSLFSIICIYYLLFVLAWKANFCNSMRNMRCWSPIWCGKCICEPYIVIVKYFNIVEFFSCYFLCYVLVFVYAGISLIVLIVFWSMFIAYMDANQGTTKEQLAAVGKNSSMAVMCTFFGLDTLAVCILLCMGTCWGCCCYRNVRKRWKIKEMFRENFVVVWIFRIIKLYTFSKPTVKKVYKISKKKYMEMRGLEIPESSEENESEESESEEEIEMEVTGEHNKNKNDQKQEPEPEQQQQDFVEDMDLDDDDDGEESEEILNDKIFEDDENEAEGDSTEEDNVKIPASNKSAIEENESSEDDDDDLWRDDT